MGMSNEMAIAPPSTNRTAASQSGILEGAFSCSASFISSPSGERGPRLLVGHPSLQLLEEVLDQDELRRKGHLRGVPLVH